MKKAALLALTTVFLFAGPAWAQPKPWIFGWGPEYYRYHDFEPYLESAKYPHNSQWNGSEWKPEHWIQQKKDELDMMRALYFSDIIRDQYVDDEIPVLEVGPNFYNLSGYDRRRVAELVDHVYEVTGEDEEGIFMLYDWDTERPIGVYTRYGLQMQ